MQASIQTRKSVIALVGCLTIFMLCRLNLNAQSGPKLFLAERVFNLDTIPCDTTFYTYIQLKNIGDTPAELLYFKTTGSIVLPRLEAKPPLGAGASISIRVGINTNGRLGPHRKTFVILSDDPEEPAIHVQYYFVVRCDRLN